jgi:hypothetical protein
MLNSMLTASREELKLKLKMTLPSVRLGARETLRL